VVRRAFYSKTHPSPPIRPCITSLVVLHILYHVLILLVSYHLQVLPLPQFPLLNFLSFVFPLSISPPFIVAGEVRDAYVTLSLAAKYILFYSRLLKKSPKESRQAYCHEVFCRRVTHANKTFIYVEGFNNFVY
jgi:hypothetical protein